MYTIYNKYGFVAMHSSLEAARRIAITVHGDIFDDDGYMVFQTVADYEM